MPFAPPLINATIYTFLLFIFVIIPQIIYLSQYQILMFFCFKIDFFALLSDKFYINSPIFISFFQFFIYTLNIYGIKKAPLCGA